MLCTITFIWHAVYESNIYVSVSYINRELGNNWLSAGRCMLIVSCVRNVILYRVSQEECARLWESVPYVKVYRYNPKHLYPKLNGYGDNGQRKLWTSCGSTYCTCPAGQVQYAFSQRPALLVQLCSGLIPKCTVSKDKPVLRYSWVFMCHVKCLEP